MINDIDTGKPASSSADADAPEDAFVVRDRASRRRFIRTGAAFALAGGAMAATARTALAADCDRSSEGCAAQCSDSDSGEGSDPTGGGKRCSNISISRNDVEVTRVEG